MQIEFVNISDVKTVDKPWGWEKWIQPGSDVYPFVLKQLLLKAGQRTSLQVHQFKSESIIILEGQGQLLTFPDFFNCEEFLANKNSELVKHVLDNLVTFDIGANSVFHTPPGTVHRMVATTDLIYIEASTQQLDDVIRLQDDRNRDHGRINSEHK
jgi:mannose-6-phosphate isomerase-like protein (cupin superfamily)